MVDPIVTGVAVNAAKSLISEIWHDLQCLLKYNNNIRKLKKKIKDLESEQSTIKVKVDAAERDGRLIEDNVSNWMENVDNIMKVVNEGLTRTSNTQWGCLYCKCPKLHSRYKLSKKALEWTAEVTALQGDASNFDTIGYLAAPGQMPFTSTQNFDGYESRTRTSNDVMEALRDNSITTIGICGMAGVGKTTLVKEIAEKVKAAKLFDEVVMAVVSKDPVIGNIQDQLAESLGLKIEEKTDRRRAERLYERLIKEDKRILVILDDLWEKLDFRKIGIPVEGERGGLKVVLTSRNIGVCNNMKAKPFEVNVLSKEESWNLFKEIAEISEETNGIRDIAEEVAKECGGLPLAIVIVGGALKGKKDYFWREVLQQLKEASVPSIPDVRNKVNAAIELSYNYLEKESKLLFLLCSLFPEDHNIPLEDLIRYAYGLQWFTNVETIARVRDKVDLIKDDLRSCYLLLAGTDEKHVKLHDVVRDVCLSSIANSGEHTHTVRHDALMEWPQDDRFVSSTAISLSFHEINQLCCGLEYGELKLLRLSFNESCKLHINEDFFKGMKEVKVLELCNFYGELPSSLESLVNLRTLCFHNCKLYGDMSVIGSQTKLEILSFYSSYLEWFPDKISNLSNLKSLDIRIAEGPPLPSGILLRLHKLEELYLGYDYKEEEYSVIITEIGSLLNLQTFQFRANSNHRLERVLENLHYEKLKRFEICNDESVFDREYQFRNALVLRDINVDLLKKHAIQYLLSYTEDLELRRNALTNLIDELDKKGFVNLKRLLLRDCDLKCLIDATSFRTSGVGAFFNLEELFIYRAKNLEELCHGNLPIGSFARLRVVHLSWLPALRYLWTASSVKYLVQLQEMYIQECEMLETIVSNDEEDDTRDIVFPMLKVLMLSGLSNFRSFGPKLDGGGPFEKVMLPNLKELTIDSVPNIKWIVHGHMPTGDFNRRVQNQLQLLHCESVEESIKSLLPRLEFMELSYLPNLKHIWTMLPEGIHVLRNLRHLRVKSCDSLRYLLSPSMAKMLVGLENLSLFRCNKMEAIIGDVTETEESVNKEKKKYGEEEESTNKIMLFPKLKRLEIDECDDFRMLCSVNIHMELPSLAVLSIENCPKMTKFCAGQLSATSLDSVKLMFRNNHSRRMSVGEFSSWLKDCESRIRCLECSFREIEKCDHLD